jgi:hypothetical protein
VQERFDRGELWLWYVDGEGRLRRIKQSFTDRAAPDAFQRQAAGRCAFHMQDLVRLVDLVDRLTRRRRLRRGKS